MSKLEIEIITRAKDICPGKVQYFVLPSSHLVASTGQTESLGLRVGSCFVLKQGLEFNKVLGSERRVTVAGFTSSDQVIILWSSGLVTLDLSPLDFRASFENENSIDFERFLDGDISAADEKLLEMFFGWESSGATLEERAATSTIGWVRSQDHLAIYSFRATGLFMTTVEVYEIFGLRIMNMVFDFGSAPIVLSLEEPAASIRRVRTRLNLSHDDLARACGLTKAAILRIENSVSRTEMPILCKLCKALGIDARRIGWERFE